MAFGGVSIALRTLICLAGLMLLFGGTAASARAQSDPPPLDQAFSLDDPPPDAGDDELSDLFETAVEGALPAPPLAPAEEAPLTRLPRIGESGTDTPALPPNQATVPAEESLRTLPGPAWQSLNSTSVPGDFLSQAPLPQFDASQSPWKQMEIGQSDSSLAQTPYTAAPSPAARPEAVSEAVSSARPDTVPLIETDERAKLRLLFSDLLPDGEAPLPPGLVDGVQFNGRDVSGLGGETAPLASDPAAPQPTAAVPPVLPNTPELRPDPNPLDNSAIGQAGSLLSDSGSSRPADWVGEGAIILPPDDPKTRAAAAKAQTPSSPRTTVKQPAPSSKPASASAGRPRAQKRAASKIISTSISILNETGNASLSDVYRSVLSQQGYSIVSVAEAPGAADSVGRTVITYRPGLRSKADSLARHLPGPKVLVEAQNSACLPAEVQIQVR